MQVPFYAHVRQYHHIQSEIDQAIQSVLESGNYVLGPAVAKFEENLARYFGCSHAVGVNSGTDALWLTFMALGVRPGDEIITTANTFFATAEAIWIAGAKVVFVDVDPVTRNIDPTLIEAAITPRTVGIVPVHLYGLCADMRAIGAVAKKHRLWVVEDDAQAIDGYGDGFAQGEYSDAVCTSFIIQKNLGTFGDGGAVMTNRSDIDANIRRLRNHGSVRRSVHTFGFNSRLDDLHAAVLSVKLRHIRRWTDQRRHWAKRYSAGLKNSGFRLPHEPEGYRHVYHLYVIEHAQRNEIERFLVGRGVDVKLHYPIAIHQQEGFPWGQPVGPLAPLPHAERNAAQCLSLPMYPELNDAEVEHVIQACLAWEREGARVAV